VRLRPTQGEKEFPFEKKERLVFLRRLGPRCCLKKLHLLLRLGERRGRASLPGSAPTWAQDPRRSDK